MNIGATAHDRRRRAGNTAEPVSPVAQVMPAVAHEPAGVVPEVPPVKVAPAVRRSFGRRAEETIPVEPLEFGFYGRLRPARAPPAIDLRYRSQEFGLNDLGLRREKVGAASLLETHLDDLLRFSHGGGDVACFADRVAERCLAVDVLAAGQGVDQVIAVQVVW